MHNAKAMAGKRRRFCVCLLNAGGCWKMERQRVRIARRVNHCLFERRITMKIPVGRCVRIEGEMGKRT